MTCEEISTVAVVGAGTMGHGIGQVFAMNGYNVNLIDISDEILGKALEKIKLSLSKFMAKGMLSESIDDILQRIKVFTDIRDGVSNVDLAVEAVPEDIDIKRDVFRKVDSISPKHAIIVSNTSALPITAMAEATGREDKVLGMHWFNPPQMMRLIEVIKCKYTSDEAMETIVSISKRMGKEPIVVNADIRGFIANRVYRAIRYEAYAMVLRGEHKPVEIDSAARYKLGLPMGPLELADFTGALEIETLETASLYKLRRQYPEWEPQEEYVKFRSFAMKLAERYVKNGKIGVKSGSGFYEYPGPGKWVKLDIPKEAGENVDILDLISPAVNVASWLISRGISGTREIDLALKLGFRFPKGLLKLSDEYGVSKIVESLNNKYEKFGAEEYGGIYMPTNYLKELAEVGGKFYS